MVEILNRRILGWYRIVSYARRINSPEYCLIPMKRGLRHMTEKLLPGTTLDLKTDRHTNKMLYQCILSQTYNATRLWHVFRILMLRKTVYPTYI